MDHRAEWEAEATELPLYDYLRRVAHKLRNQNGVIPGYGIVKFPTIARRTWSARRTEP